MAPDMIFFFLGLAASLTGAYFIAVTLFKKFWKLDVPHRKLIGFLGVFLASFLAISFAIGAIVSHNVPFGR